MTNLGGSDFIAVGLNVTNGRELWRWQVRVGVRITSATDERRSIINFLCTVSSSERPFLRQTSYPRRGQRPARSQ